MAYYLPDLPISTICLTFFAHQIILGKKARSPIDRSWLESLFWFFIEPSSQGPSPALGDGEIGGPSDDI
jgi:hypothetical protein